MSSSDIAISVRDLSKAYTIAHNDAKHSTMAEAMLHRVKNPLQRAEKATFWAIKDVSFDIHRGDVVGIIGRNGAGKSTLLKILSRITEPTSGKAILRGRVGSLLEVGTGFHPELSGRENIYMNGAILGMSRREIANHFDAIVDFAGVEQFLDTPVKRYSSGMYVRLAFAVAAHLNPEILIVDEVLAVGDAEFQKKCIGKMQDVARQEGRTVLFVSHNMAAVRNLCLYGIVLDLGRTKFIGNSSEAITQYMAGPAERIPLHERLDRTGTGELKILEIEYRDLQGNPLQEVASGQDFDVYLHYEALPGYNNRWLTVGIQVTTSFDAPVFLHHNRLTQDAFGLLPQKGAFVCRIQRLPLPPSQYRIRYSVMFGYEYVDRIDDAGAMTVISGNFYDSPELPPATHGTCLVDANWRLAETNAPATASLL